MPSGALAQVDEVEQILPECELAGFSATPELRALIPASIALGFQVLPVHADEQEVWIATADPLNLAARQLVPLHLDRPIRWVQAPAPKLHEALRNTFGVGADTFEAIMEGRDPEEALEDMRQETTDLDEEDSEASVIKFVNQILQEALRQHATDVHVEPLEDDLRIRYRIDGVLSETPVPSNIQMLKASVIARLKIMANLDIAEKRLPQDGRINLEYEGEAIDVRVATIPTVHGETVSLRLLGQEKFDFIRLRLEPAQEKIVRDLIKLPNGIILVTGPTGSGKSTTLYTLLSMLNTLERRIVTVEDPVEHKLSGVMQIAIKPEIDLTFAKGLRSILRADPNVIMVGEMRDFETAEIAIRAALTGHLVFSTLHTNDAIGGITRLIDMGVEPFLVASSVRAFIAQRLVRTLCPHCRQKTDHAPEYLRDIRYPFPSEAVYKAVGCERCRLTGYDGRLALYEVVPVTPHLHDAICRRATTGELRRIAIEEKMVPLVHYGWAKVRQGTTTIEEVMRVTTADLEVLDE
ncbi:MAG: GspE/PulE family protein [Candidatus Methylacidiphilales bacterium]|nr:GspE/PulE family protein [Candidatus Methylacidiphilales bacterium]